MSSLGTSSPGAASTFRYLMRWPVCRLSWLKEIFSDSEVAGYSATGQVTRDSLRKPFQLARGAMYAKLRRGQLGFKTNGGPRFRHPLDRKQRGIGRRPPHLSSIESISAENSVNRFFFRSLAHACCDTP